MVSSMGHPTTWKSWKRLPNTHLTLRGLTLDGGQVKIDVNLLSEMMLTSGGNAVGASCFDSRKPVCLP
jgi:hypothetical protein